MNFYKSKNTRKNILSQIAKKTQRDQIKRLIYKWEKQNQEESS